MTIPPVLSIVFIYFYITLGRLHQDHAAAAPAALPVLREPRHRLLPGQAYVQPSHQENNKIINSRMRKYYKSYV